jgi:transposase
VNKFYPSDLTDSQWNLIKDFFPLPKATGRPRENEFRLGVNGIFYITKTGVPWRYMPKEYPK